MTDVLIRLQNAHVMEILFAASVVLILIDYFFPVDWPAFLGYFCFAFGMLFALPLSQLGSLIAAIVIFVLLLVLHRFWFSRFLTNAHQNRTAA
jgi:membrane protein implicated in regulation of membrane protease activity